MFLFCIRASELLYSTGRLAGRRIGAAGSCNPGSQARGQSPDPKLAISKKSLHFSISPKSRKSTKTQDILPKSLKLRRRRSPRPIPYANPFQIH